MTRAVDFSARGGPRRACAGIADGIGATLSVAAGHAHRAVCRRRATDLVARVIADKMHDPLGQSIVVENVAGAGGSIAATRVARAAPDGYTLEIGNNGSNLLVGALYALPVDIIADFAPVAKLTVNPQIVISKKAIPAANLKELLAWLKDNQNHVSVGIAGPVAEVSVVNFETMIAAKFQHVPYRGAAPAIQDLIAGHIDLMVDQLSNSVPQIKAGTVKPMRWRPAPARPPSPISRAWTRPGCPVSTARSGTGFGCLTARRRM